MKKPFPAHCRDCAHSKTDLQHDWELRCHHPKVNAKDSWALANGKGNGSTCYTERDGGWLAACGQRGALWEAKDLVTANVDFSGSTQLYGCESAGK
jgi:hypothetical protein